MANPNERAKAYAELSDKAKRLVDDEGLTVAEALYVERQVEAGADKAGVIKLVKADRIGADALASTSNVVPGGNTAPPNPNATLSREEQLQNLVRARNNLEARIEALQAEIDERTQLEEAAAVPQPAENEAPTDASGVELTFENGEVPQEDVDTAVEGDNGGTLRTSSRLSANPFNEGGEDGDQG